MQARQKIRSIDYLKSHAAQISEEVPDLLHGNERWVYGDPACASRCLPLTDGWPTASGLCSARSQAFSLICCCSNGGGSARSAPSTRICRAQRERGRDRFRHRGERRRWRRRSAPAACAWPTACR